MPPLWPQHSRASGAASASADTVTETVTVPANLISKTQDQAYTQELLTTIDEVCRRANNPVIGERYWNYRACRASERARLAAQEPTGLLAQRLGETRTQAEAMYRDDRAEAALQHG